MCTDHNGKKFLSLTEMVYYHNLSLSLYKYRIRKGMTREEALSTKTNKYINIFNIQDHLGNEYNTVQDMCKQYNISESLYYNRLKYQWNLKRILTTPRRKNILKPIDHLGNEYKNIKTMLNSLNISYKSLYNEVNKGYSQKEAIINIIR